jgi:hypothetical protein
MYRYKLILNNNKEYNIQSPINNITEFAESVFKSCMCQDFLLSKPYVDEDGNKINTIMIKSDNIIAFEYCTNWDNK